MAWTYFLMWHEVVPEDMEDKFATGDESEALLVAQRRADENGRPVDVLRVQEGLAETQPYRTIHPSL